MNVLVLIASLALAFAKVSYKGYHGLSVTTPDEKSVKFVESLEGSAGVKLMLDISTHREAEIAVPPAVYEDVKKQLEENDVLFVELYTDLEEEVEQQMKLSRKNLNLAQYRSGGKFDFTIATYFPTYKQSIDWINELERKYPDLAKVEVLGKTYEGRDQVVLKVGKPSDSTKEAIWMDAAIHAREWATVPSVLYTASKLLALYDSEDAEASTKALLDKFDFYLMPVFNPDGYVYTHEMDRFWRKNRRPHDNGYCFGVDLNRNFGHKWGVSGVSYRECDDSYLGPEPFSEPETQNVRDKLLELKGHIAMYINLHAYGQLLFYPWAYDNQAHLERYHDHVRVANAMKQAIFGTGYRHTSYRVGRAGDLIYNAAGGTFDWVYAVADAHVAFAAELSPSFNRGMGLGGFEISPNEMPAIADEVYRGFKAAAEALS